MREIKFRAWIGGKMVYFTHEDLWVDGLCCWDNSEPYPYRYAKTMQYTGLEDKNVQEIYEGDILAVINIDDESDRNCIVEWNTDGAYLYEPLDGYGDYDITTIGWAMEMGFSFEVIGNIYENPELCT